MSSLSAETRALLAREGLAPRKRLAQHFLVDKTVVARMVDLAAVRPDEAVLEIGPGLGALTDALATVAGQLYVVEIDRGLCEVLRRKYATHSSVHVIEGDALRVDFQRSIPEPTVKVVASLPYNAAAPILFRLLEERAVFSDVTVMVQREVAERLVARAGTRAYGAPSLLFQLYARVLGRFRVGPAAFYPRPQVVSEVLRMALDAEPTRRARRPGAVHGDRPRRLQSASQDAAQRPAGDAGAHGAPAGRLGRHLRHHRRRRTRPRRDARSSRPSRRSATRRRVRSRRRGR